MQIMGVRADAKLIDAGRRVVHGGGDTVYRKSTQDVTSSSYDGTIVDNDVYITTAPTWVCTARDLNGTGLPGYARFFVYDGDDTDTRRGNTGTDVLFAARVEGDAHDRYQIRASGDIYVGPGSTAPTATAASGTGIVNVLDYGAVGDGVTDDTAALEAAIAAGANGVVYLPAGTYKTTTLQIDDPCCIMGAGMGLSTLSNANTNGNHYIAVRSSGVTIRDLTVDGNRSSQLAATGSAISIAGTGASDPLTFIEDVSVLDCEVHGNGFDCIGVYAVDGFLVSGCYVRDVYDTGIDVVAGSINGRIIGNTVRLGGTSGGTEASRFGIALDNGTVGYSDVSEISVVGNTVVSESDSDVRWGIFVGGVTRSTVMGNTVVMAGVVQGGIRVSNEATLITVTGNTVKGSSSATAGGIQVNGVDQAEKSSTVAGNVVYGFSGSNAAGIDVYYANTVSVFANVVKSCYYGINVTGVSGNVATGIVVASNAVKDCSTVAIRFSGATGANVVRVSDNVITGSPTYTYSVDSAYTLYGSGFSTTGSYVESGADLRVKMIPGVIPTVASASTITLPSYADVCVISGTTGITGITAGWTGRQVILRFSGSLTVTDGSNLKLAGDFTATDHDTLTLLCDGTDWYEVARSAN